ncbi:MAG: hypothetical protein ABI601_14630 [bacterium]
MLSSRSSSSTPHRRSSTRHFVALHALVLLGACGGGTEATSTAPPSARPLAFTAGGGATDTIESPNRVRISLRALDNSGAPLAKAQLTLRIRPVPAGAGFGGKVPGALSQSFLTTDAQGLASTELLFGFTAGASYIVAEDLQRGAIDSIPFTVKPGAPARIDSAPRDTAAFVGGGYQLVGSTLDRRGNAVSGALTYTADSVAGVASVSTGGRVTALAVGRGRFLVRLAGTTAVDTVRVTIVPSGKLAAESSDGLVTMSLDGSGYRILVPGSESYSFPSWSPDGTAIVYNSDPRVGVLYKVDLQGTVTKLTPSGGMPSETWPRYSADGQFIYFSGGYYPDSIDTYRMRADGSGSRTRVTPTRPGSTRYWKASPSPDGTLLAYSEAGFTLHVVNLLSGNDRVIAVAGDAEAPRFSPSGQWIAFANEFTNSIDIIRADGTGHRVLTPPSQFADKWGHDWSPDGEWIVFSVGGGLEIVRAADGLVLRLPFAHNLYSASWHQ